MYLVMNRFGHPRVGGVAHDRPFRSKPSWPKLVTLEQAFGGGRVEAQRRAYVKAVA